MNEANPPRPLESHGVTWARVRLAHRLGRAAVASAAAVLVANALNRAVFEAGALPGAVVSLVTMALLVASFIVWFQRAAWPGAVTFDAAGLDVRRGGTTRRIERSRIASAYAVTRYARRTFVPTVEMELEGGDLVSFEVSSDETARAIVDDLGFGRGKKRIRIALGSPARRLYHVLVGLVAYYVASIAAAPVMLLAGGAEWLVMLGGLVNALALVGAYAFLRGLVRAPEVTIGDDGVLYRAGRKRRFLPGAAITAVEQPSVALPLLVHASGAVPLAIHGSALDVERRSAVARLAYERFVGPSAPADQDGAQFARGGRTVAAWREHLRARGRDVGYREAASPTDVAAAVLCNPRSTSEERVGAALALRVAGEPEARIRVAAGAVADDRLRVALETIAEVDDDVAIERALRKLR